MTDVYLVAQKVDGVQKILSRTLLNHEDAQRDLNDMLVVFRERAAAHIEPPFLVKLQYTPE